MRGFMKRLWLPAAMVLILTLTFGCAATRKATAPVKADWQFHDIVDAAFVQQYARVPQPEGVMIIDARSYKPNYIKGHIPTAVSLPASQFEKLADKLLQDKSSLLVFYCSGPT